MSSLCYRDSLPHKGSSSEVLNKCLKIITFVCNRNCKIPLEQYSALNFRLCTLTKYNLINFNRPSFVTLKPSPNVPTKPGQGNTTSISLSWSGRQLQGIIWHLGSRARTDHSAPAHQVGVTHVPKIALVIEFPHIYWLGRSDNLNGFKINTELFVSMLAELLELEYAPAVSSPTILAVKNLAMTPVVWWETSFPVWFVHPKSAVQSYFKSSSEVILVSWVPPREHLKVLHFSKYDHNLNHYGAFSSTNIQW